MAGAVDAAKGETFRPVFVTKSSPSRPPFRGAPPTLYCLSFRPTRAALARPVVVSPAVAQSSGRDPSRSLAELAADARPGLPSSGRGVRRPRAGAFAQAEERRRRRDQDRARGLRQPAARHARWRRHQAGGNACSGMARQTGTGDRSRGRLCLERQNLWKPVRDRQGDHRHKLERPSLLRVAIRPQISSENDSQSRQGCEIRRLPAQWSRAMTLERQKARLRCAIYTRVSSDAGPEQDSDSPAKRKGGDETQSWPAQTPIPREGVIKGSAAMARLSPSLSPPPAGCRTRCGPRSPACASAATPSVLIVPTRPEDRSIGSRRRRWAGIAQRRTL